MAKWARVHSKKAKRLYFVEPIAKRADAKGSMLAATAIATHWLSSFPFFVGENGRNKPQVRKICRCHYQISGRLFARSSPFGLLPFGLVEWVRLERWLPLGASCSHFVVPSRGLRLMWPSA